MAKTRIRTQFLSLFIVVGVVPLVIVGALFFFQTSKILMSGSYESVSAIHNIRNNSIVSGIKQRYLAFESLMSNEAVSNAITMANNGNMNREIEERYGDYFLSYLQSNDFYNVFILSAVNGDILFNFQKEEGKHKDSGLYRAWEKAVKGKDVILEEFSPFEPSGGVYSAFIAKAFRDRNNNVLGVVVIQLTDTFIDGILKSREGMGETGESYLISFDKYKREFEFRSNMATMGDGEYSIGYIWKKPPLEYWSKAVLTGVSGGSGEFTDSDGERCIVVYNKLDLPSLNWYLISKIDKREVLSNITDLLIVIIWISVGINILIALLSVIFSGKLTDPIIKGVDFAKEIALGHYDRNLDINREDEIGLLARSLRDMGRTLREQAWIREGKEGLDDVLRGDHNVKSLGNKFVSFMVRYLDAQIGALYIPDEKNSNRLLLTFSYAFSDRERVFSEIELGEGLVGQAALDKTEIVYTHVPADSPEFNFGAGTVLPVCYVATPLVFEDEIAGVFLIGMPVPISTLKRKFITNVKDGVAILINSAKSSTVIQELLEDAQVKQEELRVSNEELEQQTIALKDSEKDLQSQQEELRVTNEELQERTQALEKQRQIMNEKNFELEKIKIDLEDKARDLERASKYKSEFLANMSHELRTPLNSILILSQLLSNNKNRNLDEKQVQSAQAINSSGEDLLRLINQILDLSKVEAGKIEITPEVMTLESLKDDLDRLYRPVSEQNGIDFIFHIDKDLPLSIITDPHRLQQVLKNLITNAFKFTERGGAVTFSMIKDGNDILLSVKDTGIGIPEDKQKAVFEAFQQADGSTSRKYGGTGLGLSISRELIKLLGGGISLESREGEGSTFSVTLPIKVGSSSSTPKEVIRGNEVVEIHVKDDRTLKTKEGKTILIIEDDVTFAAILKEQAHEMGLKVLIAEDGETGLHFADYYRPDGIILDLGLPGIDGFSVMDRLKNDPELVNIPIHVMSGMEEEREAINMGAIGYMTKPVDINGIKEALIRIEESISSGFTRLLIIEDDNLQRESLKALIEGDDVSIDAVGSGKEAFEAMKNVKFDCIILDLGLEDMSGYDLLDKISGESESTPVIIYTGRDLSSEDEMRLNRYAESIIIKGIKSPDRLLEETSVFLKRVNKEGSEAVFEDKKIKKREEVLSGKNILVVDDDMRNIFALTNILEEKDINVIVARDGIESIEKVKSEKDIDLVLMDIMMPRMDGYEAIGEIRKIKNKDKLPIIALTANAMKGDRNKCIDAGANDYLAKPVDNNKLVSMLRVWLYK